MTVRRRSPSNFDYEGAPLIRALYDQAEQRGEWTNEIADHIGLSPSYFSSIAGGMRPVGALNRATLQKCADYLAVPLVQVYVLAEHLGPEAFLSKETVDTHLDRGFRMIREDSDWSMVAPKESEWKELPFSAKVLIVLLYQRLTGRQIIESIKVHEYTD